MQICEDELETGAFPCWYAADLVQSPVGVQDFLHPHPVEVSSQQEVYFVIVLRPYRVDSMYDMIHSLFLKWAPWSNVNGGNANSLHSLQFVIQLEGSNDTPLCFYTKWHRYISICCLESDLLYIIAAPPPVLPGYSLPALLPSILVAGVSRPLQ